MPYRVLFGVVTVAAMLGARAGGQSTAEPLLRIESRTLWRETCALVRADGHFLLEDVDERKTSIYEDVLSDAELASLRGAVNTPELVALRPSSMSIAHMVPADKEGLYLSVNRPSGWQNLVLLDKVTPREAGTAVETLVRWLHVTRKQRRASLAGAERTNCLLPGITLGSGHPLQDSTNVQEPHLVRWQQWRFDSQTLTTACACVLPGGAIRYERQRHQWRKAGKVEVAEGALPPEALNELKQLLNSPVLVAVDMPADLFPSWVSVADVDSFSIPRGDTVQHLGAGMLFRSSGNFGAPRALGEPKIVRPLVRWFEKNIVKSKFAKSVAATANGCRYVTDQIASTPSKP